MQAKIDIYIQLDPKVTRVIKVVANVEKLFDSTGSNYWTIKAQFLRLQPFMGRSGLEVRI